MVFTPTPRILFLSGIFSAILSTLIFHFAKFQIDNIITSLNADEFKPDQNYSNKSMPEIQTVEEPIEVNKLVDAIFVSHGMPDELKSQESSLVASEAVAEPIIVDSAKIELSSETVQKIQPEIIVLDKKNFRDVYDGDWLILANVPWLNTGMRFQEHFSTVFPEILSRHSNIKLATLNCNEESLLAGILQVRQYPSLLLVTDSGRLREWPFDSNHMSAETFRFLVHREWKHIPVYQRIPFGPAHQFALKSIQIRIFNNISGFLIQKEEDVFDWLRSHTNLARGLVLGTLAAVITLTRK